MGAGADVYKPVTDMLRQWLIIPEYLHKMFKSMHMQVIVIEIISHISYLFGTVKEHVSIMK